MLVNMLYSRRQSALVALTGLAGLLTSRLARAADTEGTKYELVEPRTCLAGHWGEPQQELRLQLAVFTSDDAEQRAEDYRAKLRQQGIAAETYIAMWLVDGDNWDRMAVVSERVFAEAAAARRAAGALRKRGVPAFARQFTRYVKPAP